MAHQRARAAAQHPPVLLIPGLMAGDWAMRPLSKRLQKRGYATERAHIGLNIGCTTSALDKLERRLDQVAESHGSTVAVVGHSRGGTLAKLLTLRRPELVAALIALASPNVNPLGVSRSVLRQLHVLNRLHAIGFSSLLGADCLSGECAEMVGAALLRQFPSGVPYALFYSKDDGVVDWQACCDPAANLVEVRGSHMQLAMRRSIIDSVVQLLDRISPVAPPVATQALQPTA